MTSGRATSNDRPEPGGGVGDGGPPPGAGPDPDGRPEARDRRRRGALADPIVVTWDERLRRPSVFVWRRRRYRIERVLENWVLETGWWKDDGEGRVSRSYWRVQADGRVVDLRYDRLGKSWALERVLS